MTKQQEWRRFQFTVDDEKKTMLETLITEKKLSRAELLIILSSMKLNKEIDLRSEINNAWKCLQE